MEVILLQRIASLGQMGDVVSVKNGYARNYLLPQKKALRATKENKAYFDTQRAQLEADNLKHKSEAESVAEKLNGQAFIIIRQAGDTGQLYGSVSTRDIAEVVTEGGFTLTRTQVILASPIKTLGIHVLNVALHPEVETKIDINVARSQDEAERQSRGEDVTVIQDEAMELETFNPDEEEGEHDHKGKDEGDSEEAAKEETPDKTDE